LIYDRHRRPATVYGGKALAAFDDSEAPNAASRYPYRGGKMVTFAGRFGGGFSKRSYLRIIKKTQTMFMGGNFTRVFEPV
jgi:hypothetical protein